MKYGKVTPQDLVEPFALELKAEALNKRLIRRAREQQARVLAESIRGITSSTGVQLEERLAGLVSTA